MSRGSRRVVLTTAEKVEGGVGAANPIITIFDYQNRICHYLIPIVGVILYKEFRDIAFRVGLSSGPAL